MALVKVSPPAKAEALWGKKWWPVTVVAVDEKNCTCEVRWDGVANTAKPGEKPSNESTYPTFSDVLRIKGQQTPPKKRTPTKASPKTAAAPSKVKGSQQCPKKRQPPETKESRVRKRGSGSGSGGGSTENQRKEAAPQQQQEEEAVVQQEQPAQQTVGDETAQSAQQQQQQQQGEKQATERDGDDEEEDEEEEEEDDQPHPNRTCTQEQQVDGESQPPTKRAKPNAVCNTTISHLKTINVSPQWNKIGDSFSVTENQHHTVEITLERLKTNPGIFFAAVDRYPETPFVHTDTQSVSEYGGVGFFPCNHVHEYRLTLNNTSGGHCLPTDKPVKQGSTLKLEVQTRATGAANITASVDGKTWWSGTSPNVQMVRSMGFGCLVCTGDSVRVTKLT